MSTSLQNNSINQLLADGNEYFIQGRYLEALQCYNQGLERDKENIFLLIHKGNVLLRLGKENKAYGCYFPAIVNAKLLNLLDPFIEGEYHCSAHDTNRLLDLLSYQHGLPFSRAGLDLVLRMMDADARDAKRLKT